jgi:nicotinate-nucleotide adenylyltransferase
MSEFKQIGLFFGSFNPIHHGHLIIANYMLVEVPFDEVWFVVSPQNPHKRKESLAGEYDRLEMVNLAIGNFDKFRALDIEFYLPRPSYTIDTLIRLKEKYPQMKFSIIIGSDNLLNFHKWKNYQVILENFKIVVYPRKDFDVNIKHENIMLIKAPIIEISSTYIREKLKKRKNVYFFLPEKVYQYIEESTLYR